MTPIRAFSTVLLRPTEQIATVTPEGHTANQPPLEAEFVCDWQSLIAAAP